MKVRKPQLLNYDAILFDVDGTLIDSAPGILNTLEEVFQKMGVDATGVNLRRYLGPAAAQELRRALHRAGQDRAGHPPLPRKLRRQGQPRMRRLPRCSGNAAAPEGRRALILCTATSKPTEVVTPILEEKGLAPYFDFIGGASMDESRDTKTDVVRYVLAQPMMQGKRVLMVGDRNDDMRGAADCGLDAAGALYGYGSREELPFHPVLLAKAAPTLQTRSWTETHDRKRPCRRKLKGMVKNGFQMNGDRIHNRKSNRLLPCRSRQCWCALCARWQLF